MERLVAGPGAAYRTACPVVHRCGRIKAVFGPICMLQAISSPIRSVKDPGGHCIDEISDCLQSRMPPPEVLLVLGKHASMLVTLVHAQSLIPRGTGLSDGWIFHH